MPSAMPTNVTNIAQDGLDNITNLIMQIKEAGGVGSLRSNGD